jgi:hypothetical protein
MSDRTPRDNRPARRLEPAGLVRKAIGIAQLNRHVMRATAARPRKNVTAGIVAMGIVAMMTHAVAATATSEKKYDAQWDSACNSTTNRETA